MNTVAVMWPCGDWGSHECPAIPEIVGRFGGATVTYEVDGYWKDPEGGVVHEPMMVVTVASHESVEATTAFLLEMLKKYTTEHTAMVFWSTNSAGQWVLHREEASGSGLDCGGITGDDRGT